MQKDEIIKKAVGALRRQTGLQLDYARSAGSKDGHDLSLSLPKGNESERIRLSTEIKEKINNVWLGGEVLENRREKKKPVLVTEYITEPQAEKLRALDIPFIDTAGNAYFNEPQFYIFISGKKREIKREKPLGLFRPAGIKLLFAFLTRPGLEKEDYRKIAELTGIPRATISELMGDLEKTGYLVRRIGRERFLTRKKELLRRWTESYSEKFRPKLKPVRFHSQKYQGRWWENIKITEFKACWGGETGGAVLTNHLRPQFASIYADSLLPRLQALYALVRDERGEIEILNKFWTFGEVGEAAPPLVVYADLLATLDQRNLETAEIIYEKYLAEFTKEAA